MFKFWIGKYLFVTGYLATNELANKFLTLFVTVLLVEGWNWLVALYWTNSFVLILHFMCFMNNSSSGSKTHFFCWVIPSEPFSTSVLNTCPGSNLHINHQFIIVWGILPNCFWSGHSLSSDEEPSSDPGILSSFSPISIHGVKFLNGLIYKLCS